MRPVYCVEHRGANFVVVDTRKRWELAPVFDHLQTADEIARKATALVAFFDNIPVCNYGSPPHERIAARALTPAERGIG